MKQGILSAAFIIAMAGTAAAQKYYTKNGSISFFSKTSLENIKADNNQVMSVLNAQTGEIQFSLFGATDDAGVPDSVAIQLAEIFGGDIDFHRDLRRGIHLPGGRQR